MDQIKVFVSSAMRPENGGVLDWPNIRKDIVESIRASALFDVFAIEQHANPDSSNQYMLANVSDCNVYLLILGHELRDGTKQEYDKALERHKDMLVYVYDVEHDDGCNALIRKIEQSDRCCYQNVKVTDDIGAIVVGGLMEHVIRRYKGHSAMQSLKAGTHESTSMAHFGTRAIKSFGTSILTLGKLLGYPYGGSANVADSAPLSEFGDKLVGWLLEGAWTPINGYKESMTQELVGAGFDDSLELITLRWRACDLYMSGKTSAAIEVLDRAASQGKDRTHVLTGVLIDLRNLVSQRDGFLARRQRQEEIDRRGADFYISAGDSFVHRASNSLRDAQDAKWLASERTDVSGEYRLADALLNISNALFVNALYGSIAGIENSRLECAKLLMCFSRLYNDRGLYVVGLRLCALGRSAKELEEWLNAGLDFASQEIVACADELWDTASISSVEAINGCGCVIFATLGMYLDNGRFLKASRAMLGAAHSVGVGSPIETKYTKAISCNAYRMNPGMLVHMVESVISEHRLQSTDWLNTVMIEARLEDASQEDRNELALILEEHYTWLVENGFSPAYVAILAGKYEEFAKFGAAVKAQLSGSDLIEYEFNELGEPLSGEYVASLIDEARSQLVANDNPGRQFDFGTRPARYLSNIIDAQLFPAIRGPVEAKISGLWNQVARSGAPGSVLDEYIWLAIRMVVVYREARLPLPDDYKALARTLKNKQPPIDPALFFYERKTWVLRVVTYRLLVGTGKKRSFLDCISDTWGAGISMREAAAECLESYLRVNRGVAFRDMAAIVGAVNVLSRDRDVQVRRKAVGCAMRLLDTSADEEAKSILLRLARDPQVDVRVQLLKYDIELQGHSDMPCELARYLNNDAHYGVRTVARRVLTQNRNEKKD